MNGKTTASKDTPLLSLSRALCGNSKSCLFGNQVVMFQLLIPFLSNQLSSFSKSYSPRSVDDLIGDIRRYLAYEFSHPDASEFGNVAAEFSEMHRYIYSNMLGAECNRKFPPFRGNSSGLSLGNLQSRIVTAPNISKTIHAHRDLPVNLRKQFLSSGDYTVLLYRCFWILQYYLVYYAESNCCRRRPHVAVSYTAMQFTEYYSLSEAKASLVYHALREKCDSYSSCFSDSQSTFDLLMLSRVVLDILVAQINLMRRVPLSQIADPSELMKRSASEIPEPEQYLDYQKYLGGFGTDSYDRYLMLLRYAPHNCYAAEELATVYYWGKTYWIRDNNYFEVAQDYRKAAEWFQKAIENFTPPLQASCWSLAYTLTNSRYDSKEDRNTAKERAKTYLLLAGDYPAAKNRLATYLFQEGEELYRASESDRALYRKALAKFEEAIRMADRAGASCWFYGNNQIAVFLRKHEADSRLLADLRFRLASLHVPLDEEAQLRYSASYSGPWALKHLALFLIRHNRAKEALPYLREAMKSNYNEAFYETAVHFHKTGSNEWLSLMTKASELFCPRATYVLAMNCMEPVEKERLIHLCRSQVLSERDMNRELLTEVDLLSKTMNP